MYPASSRHSDRRPRSARKAGPNRRPLLEALEPRQLMAASTEVSWVKLESPSITTATNGSETYTTDGSWLTMSIGPQDMATARARGRVTAATDGHAYTSEVAKYGLSGGLHLEWSHPGYFPNVSDVDAADDGSVYVVGTYRTAFDADPGPGTHMLSDPQYLGQNAYVVKLDPAGHFLWGGAVGGDGASGVLNSSNAVQLAVDPAGNAYVAVNYVTGFRPPFEGGGAVLMKFAASGQGGWREAIGDFRSAVTRLAASPDGSGVAVAISGPTLTAEDLAPVASRSSVEHYPSSGGTPPNNSFVARYDAGGALSWARQPEINSDARNVGPATALDISPRGDVLIAAGASDGVASFALVQRYDSLGNLLSRQAYDGLAITSIADSDSQIHLNISGTFSGTVDIDPGYSTDEITVPAGATTAGVLFRLIDPSGGSERLLGTPIGTPGSWNNSGNDFTKALDNNYSSYFDAPTSQPYVGYDFGRATIVDHAEYIPRTGYEFRMVGGQFQGSNDGSNWTTVATITATPKAGVRNFLAFAAPVTYRYMRYLSPVDGFGNAAEISFNGAGPEAYPPDVPLHPVTSWDGTRVWVNWTDVATNETGYRAELFANPDFTGTPLATAERGSNFHSLYFSDFNTPGTYYVRVLAYNSYNRSFWAPAGSVTIPVVPPAPPAAPTDIIPVSNAGTVQFSWRDNANNETGYAIELSLDPNFAPANDLVNAIVSANTTGYAYGPATPGLTYYFRVRAVNATSAGTSYSAFATASTVYSPPTDVPDPLVGTPIGTPGSWNNTGAVFTNAFDGQTNTFFDAPTSQAYVGYDFGTPATVTHVTYFPRIGNAERMVGGQVRGSNDNVNWTTLATITSTPAYGFNTLDIPNPAAFRYVEYLSPVGGFGNVAELRFSGTRDTAPTPPAAPTGVAGFPDGTSSPSSIRVLWTDNANNETGYQVQASTTSDFSAHVITINTPADPNGAVLTSLTAGTYYIRVRALGTGGANSDWVLAARTVTLGPPVAGDQLVGTIIGTEGSWNDSGNDRTKVFDGDTTTFFDAPIGDAWVGLDLGTAQALDHVRFFPRAGLAWRMVDGTFHGSNDGTTWTTLAKITSEPAEGTYTSMSLSGTYRYVRYQGAAWGSGNVAELQFYGTGTQPPPPSLPAAPTGLTVTGGLNQLTVTWADNATNETGYIVDYSPSPDFVPGTPGSGSSILSANATSDTRLINPGTVYYVRVRATNAAGASANATAGPVTTTAVRLTGGTPIGTPGSWNNSGNDITKAFDGATSSYFDAPTSQAYVGLDFGTPTAVSSVTFYPRVGQESRMLGGTFRVSDDGVNWTNVGGIGFVPQPNVPFTLNFGNPAPHRYVAYFSPDGGWGNVAELQFYGQPATTSPVPVAPSNVTAELAVVNGIVNLYYKWTVAGFNAPDVGYQISTVPDFATIFSDGTLSTATGLLYQNPPSGTYYFRVRTINAAGASAFVAAPGSLTVPAGVPQDPTRLLGRDIGTGSAYDTPTSYGRALDGNVSTYFDSPTSQAYVGYDLGSLATLTSVRVYPRQGFASRMVGGAIQGSNDNVNWTTLATISSAPAENQYTTLPINDARTFAYVRYLSPVGGYGDIAELQFYGRSTTAPLAPADVAGTADGTTSIRVSWTNVSRGSEAGFEAQVSTTPDFSAGVVTRTTFSGTAQVLFTSLGDGTYYIRVRALGGTHPNSDWTLSAEVVTLGPPVVGTQLTGTVIGTPGSWNDSGNDRTKAFDGDTATFFDAPIGDAWVGLDLGTARPIDYVRFFPRAGLAWRMVDGTFQGSNDGTTWTTLAKITSEPAEGAFSVMSLGGGSYRYVRYQGAAWGSGNVAELQFYSAGGPVAPAAPTGVAGTVVGSNSIHYAWQDVAGETSYEYQFSTSPGFETTLAAGPLAANARGTDIGNLAPGTYYFRIRAVNAVGASAYTNASPVNIPVNPVRLLGTPIGTAGSWNNSGNTFDKALDDNSNTFFDAPTSQAYVGLSLDGWRGITSVRLTPRAGYAWRVPGGQIQTSSDGTNWTTVLTITATPPDGTPTTYTLPAGTQARFVRYLSPEDGFGNIADIQFYGYTAATP